MSSSASESLSEVTASPDVTTPHVWYVEASNSAAGFNFSVVSDWDPAINSDRQPEPLCISRIQRDISSIYQDPLPGIFIVPDETDITIIHALITGTSGTPYEGGFFYFYVRCPSDYPFKPPRVKLMTTGAGTVRFNPNIYENGKVCASILGTYPGPGWTPAYSITAVLVSIQSLLNEKPYHNEPGYEVEREPGDIVRYNDMIQHETIRVAVCGMLENETYLTIPDELVEVMRKKFLEFYDYYVSTVQKKSYLNGEPIMDPFTRFDNQMDQSRGSFQYGDILTRLEALHKKLSAKYSKLQETG